LLLSLLLSGVFAAGADGTWSNPAAVTTATLSSTSGSADLTWSGSAFAVGQQLRLTGTVPGGFNANTNYFVVAASGSTIQLSRTWGGAAVSATSSITNGTAQAYQSWQTTANWSAGVPADGVDAVATFTNSPSASVAGVTLDGNVTLGKLVYTNTANSADMALISGNSASHTLTWATSGTVAGLEVPMLEVPAATNRLLNLGQTGVLKFAGTQGLIVRSSASGPLTGLGLGATQVAPAKNLRITSIDWSSFSGGLVIQRGVLQLQAANQLPGQSVTLGDLFSADNNQIVELTSTTAQTVGALHGNAWGRISGAFTLTVGGNNATGGDFGGVFGQTTPGVATAVTNLVKTGTGTQVFSGALKGGGSVTVNSGLLVIDGTHVPGVTTGAAGKYTVNAGGALGGRGMIKPLDTLGGLAGAIDLKSGAVLAPGNPAIASGIGALTLDQSTALSPVLNFSAGATATFDLGGAGQRSGSGRRRGGGRE
jgi:autotransporter-associated beta strand protein